MKKITYGQLWHKFDDKVVKVHPILWAALRVIGFVLAFIVWFFALSISIILISTIHDVSVIKYFPLLGTCIVLVGLIYVLFFRKHQEE